MATAATWDSRYNAGSSIALNCRLVILMGSTTPSNMGDTLFSSIELELNNSTPVLLGLNFHQFTIYPSSSPLFADRHWLRIPPATLESITYWWQCTPNLLTSPSSFMHILNSIWDKMESCRGCALWGSNHMPPLYDVCHMQWYSWGWFCTLGNLNHLSFPKPLVVFL